MILFILFSAIFRVEKTRAEGFLLSADCLPKRRPVPQVWEEGALCLCPSLLRAPAELAARPRSASVPAPADQMARPPSWALPSKAVLDWEFGTHNRF